MGSKARTDDSQPVVFLMGPTASGKTELALHLVERLPCDIVSVDSAMMYRGMDIGTAKPDAETQRVAPHRLIDIRDPAEVYSAAQFRADATREIRDIHAAGRIPLLVGGTMLYFRALEQGLSPLPEADARIRARISEQGERLGWSALHARLAERDPDSAARIHRNDAQRIQRALEVLELTGRPPSHWYAQADEKGMPWRACKLALAPASRRCLHDRIGLRLEWMLQSNFLAEVEKLHQRPDLDLDTPALRAVGYRQFWRYLDGDWDFAEAKHRALIATRQLAKRQLTWLRAEPHLRWLDAEDSSRFEDAVKSVKNCVERG